MRLEEVLACSERFVDAMKDLVDPSEFAFDAFTVGPPLDGIAEGARRHCRCAPDRATASLTVVTGESNAFEIKGAHALATIERNASGPGPRLALLGLIAALVVTMMILLLTGRRR